MPRISTISPTVRPHGIEMVKKCLERQSFTDFEWIIVTPNKFVTSVTDIIKNSNMDIMVLGEPPKREGDYYRLNGAWNWAFKHAQGELMVNIVDLIWFQPDVLDALWNHYLADNKSCVSAIGHQYDQLKNGKPENRVWVDPRARTDLGSFYEVGPKEMELCLASIPMAGIKEVGGLDEEFDKYAALSEKEMCYRLERRNYKFYLDQGIEYRAMKHPRLNEEWDKHYEAGLSYYMKCLKEIAEETRKL